MFGAATRRLSTWLVDVCPDAEIVLTPPPAMDAARQHGRQADGRSVHVFLAEVHSLESRRDRRRRSDDKVVVRFRTAEAVIRYVVAVAGADPVAGHDLLGEIFLASGDQADIRVADRAVDLSVWEAYGVEPCPALFVDVRIRSHQDDPVDGPVVTETRVEARSRLPDHSTEAGG